MDSVMGNLVPDFIPIDISDAWERQGLFISPTRIMFAFYQNGDNALPRTSWEHEFCPSFDAKPYYG